MRTVERNGNVLLSPSQSDTLYTHACKSSSSSSNAYTYTHTDADVNMHMRVTETENIMSVYVCASVCVCVSVFPFIVVSLFCLLLPLSVVGSPPANFTVGALFTFTRSGLAFDLTHPQSLRAYETCWNVSEACPQYSGPARYSVLRYQFDQINANPNLLPNTTLLLDVIDDQGTASGGFFGALTLLQTGHRIFTGPSFSSASSDAALAATNFQVPQIAYSASANFLANKKQYPYFMRVCQDDAG